MNPHPLFSMCSLYPKDERMICACFLGKDSKIVEDMKKLSVDYLMWASLVSGAISLQDLEQEAGGRRVWDKKGRDDTSFIKECNQEGIKVFSVLFTAQGYEIGITTDKKEEKLVEFGRTLKGKEKYWGLSEFYQNKYPKIFKGWKDYFDQPLLDEKKRPIKDFLQETTCYNLKGEPCHALWTQETNKYFDLKTFLMCQNSPHWQNYLKKIIEMQIDAGCDGILFDETGSPFDWGIMGSGFCKHCMNKFREYLVGKYGERFQNFDYKKTLKKRGQGFGAIITYFRDAPLGLDFKNWQKLAIRDNFKELVDYARQYSQKKSKEVLIAGNFAEVTPFYFPLVDLIDIFNLEMMFEMPPNNRNTSLYRLSKALAKEKPVTAVPTIFNTANLRERSKYNLTTNLERYFIAEAAANLANYQIPYSGFTIEGKGAYYPQVEELALYQSFIAKHKEFYQGEPLADVSLVCSYYSYFWSFNWINYPGRHMKSFLGIEKLLSHLFIPHKIIILGDDKYLEEVPKEISPKVLILPNIEYLSKGQIEWLNRYSAKILIIGRFAIFNERGEERKKRLSLEALYLKDDLGSKYEWSARKSITEEFAKRLKELLPCPSISTNLPPGSILSIYKHSTQITIHIVNGQYIEKEDSFEPLKDISITLKEGEINLQFKICNLKWSKATLFTPEKGREELTSSKEEEGISLFIPEITLYGVVKIEFKQTTL